MTDTFIPRKTLVWLLVSQLLVLAPHWLTAPLWIPAVWLVVVFWRWKIFAKRWRYPGKMVKSLLLIICCGGLFFSFGGKVGTSGMVSLLLAGFTLKLLEMKRHRDGLIICFLGYLVVATQFLFFSSILAALYGLVCLVLLTWTLLLLSVSEQDNYPAIENVKALLWPAIQAMVLMLLLFLFFPRFGPFWAVPLDSNTARTGMSDSLSPGSFGQLLRSSEPAFRVSFQGRGPEVSQMYWRGLVFSGFDGRSWTFSQAQRDPSRLRRDKTSAREYLEQVIVSGEALNYEVILEPSQQPWLFVLGAVSDWSSGVAIDPELSLRWRRPISQRIQYSVSSFTQFSFQSRADSLTESLRRQNLQFPADINPQTVNTARQWLNEATTAEQYIARVLDYFSDRFMYTLQPGVLGSHPVDDFLWQTHAGFCEHFASAFTLLMRAANIPARVVTGYQGGEYNAAENYWLVRQRDAHAWVEVWLDNKGWVAIDPTAAVAPERIERGIDYSLADSDRQLLGNLFSRNFAVFNYVRLRMDALNYQWTRWVLNYDRERQNTFFQSWRDAVNWVFMGVVVSIAALLLLVFFTVKNAVRHRQQDKTDVLYRLFEKKIKSAGLVRAAGETPKHFAGRVAQLRPDLANAVQDIAHTYQKIKYADEHELLEDFSAQIKRFKV